MCYLCYTQPNKQGPWCSSSSPMGTVATTMRCFCSFLLRPPLLGLEFLEFSCGHGDAGGCAAVDRSSCWLKNGAWRAPCDDPYLAKAVDSPCFCQIWFASLFVSLSTITQLVSYTSHAHIAPIWLLLPPSSIGLHDFSSPLSTLVSSCPRLSTSVS